jgi:uncharacterized protein (TIGR00255 family)
MPIRSMTGFARVRREAAGQEFTVSVKSVNHRGLDLHFHIGSELDPLENDLRNLVKRNVNRGHVDIRIHAARSSPNGVFAVDQARVAAYVAAFRQAASEHGITGEPDLNGAFRIPGILTDSVGMEFSPEVHKVLLGAFEEALGELNAFREREGSQLATVIRDRNKSLLSIADELDAIRSQAARLLHDRLQTKLADLLSGASLDPQRLAQEAAILAEKSDIGEEIERLRIHARQLNELIDEGGETGKRLDFLLQEMNRETNTILSKTTGLGGQGLRITELALGAKSDIEKIRELALNLE